MQSAIGPGDRLRPERAERREGGDSAQPMKGPGDQLRPEHAERRDRKSGNNSNQDPAERRENPLVTTDRLDHVHLYVTDRPAAVAWYARVLGLKPYGPWDDADPAPDHPVFLAPAIGGAHVVSLFTGAHPEGGDRTVAFHANARAFLGFAAALPHQDVAALDGSPLTAKGHHDYGMAITFNFLDPAGNHLELVTYDHAAVRADLAGAPQ